MPEIKDLLEGFNLIQGEKIGNGSISKVTATRKVIRQYKEYEYDIYVSIPASVNQEVAINQLSKLTDGTKTIYSAYGNPYECYIDLPIFHEKSGGMNVYYMLGHSHRV